MPFPQLWVLGLLTNDRVFHDGVAEVIHHRRDGKDAGTRFQVIRLLHSSSILRWWTLTVMAKSPKLSSAKAARRDLFRSKPADLKAQVAAVRRRNSLPNRSRVKIASTLE